ncbi:MAG TPA: hypothetical protein VEB39_02015 [Sphingomicrobium sp.]|nr:hypothetical protein [Sphingomicrobium sp.]
MTEPRQDRSEELPRRLLKYLPVMMVGHLAITIPTFVISIALAYATFVQADATHKIQQSETWPYISYGTSNISDEGVDEITFMLGNDGMGPARLKQLEFLYDGRPMQNPRQFLQLCCGDSRSNPTQFKSSGFEVVLRPGETTYFIGLTKKPENAAVWERLNAERWKVAVRACYCSIFDDCFVLDTRRADPQPVEACPANWARFEERPFPTVRPPARN